MDGDMAEKLLTILEQEDQDANSSMDSTKGLENAHSIERLENTDSADMQRCVVRPSRPTVAGQQDNRQEKSCSWREL